MGKFILLFFTLCLFIAPVFSEEVILTKDGKALLDVVVSEKATEKTKKNAEEFVAYLNKITQANFVITTENTDKGMLVGTIQDFPSLPYAKMFDTKDPFRRDEYIIKSHKDALFIVGATEIGVQHGIWDFLYRIGYRQFFPTLTWEVIPEIKSLKVNLDVYGKPSFFGRNIGKGHLFWGQNKNTWNDWMKKNRMQCGFFVPSGHAYQAIISTYKNVFTQHPEYLGLVGGERKSSKFCISNPGLQELIKEYAIKYFEKNTDADGLSMEPSDGGNWCECEECKKIGSITDRAVFLSNITARAIREKYPSRFVGMLAYHYHAPYPSIKVEPNVIVNITTHQRKGGHTLDELIDGWKEQGAMVGISDAFCTYIWDYAVPGRPRVSDITYLTENLPSFYQKGIRLISGWTSDTWGPAGLGNYMLSRFLWDVNETKKVDALFNDFLEKCFGDAKEPMEKFYRLIYKIDEKDKRPLFSEDLIGRMYRYLDQALAKTKEPAIRNRIYDLILYTGYAERYLKYAQAKSTEKQQNFEEMMKYIYRMKNTQMIDLVAAYVTLQDMAKDVTLPETARWNVPEGKNPWKVKDPFTEEEILAILKNGIANNSLFPIEPVSFSEKLTPVRGLENIVVRDKTLVGDEGVQSGAPQTIYTWIEKAPAKIKLQVTGGLISFYRDYGNVRIYLYSSKSPEIPVAQDTSVPPDGKPYEITLETPHTGLHWFKITSGKDRAKVKIIEPDLPWTFESGIKGRTFSPGTMWSMYFYVPKGTKVVAGYSDGGAGKILDGNGREVFSFAGLPRYTYFKVDVPERQDGRLWMFSGCNGRKILLNVPPYLSPSAEKLLLPEEVVNEVGGKK
ncbi:MAG: DUF4838 domain-containing protein [Candidatus Omnitrophica bacterium]|nr:DUF4838 domain-containing protein [Candidatus Omnitrophota bacterium]